MRHPSLVAAILLCAASAARGQVPSDAFPNWETAPVHPVAISPDGTRLAVCNLPDHRIEFFALGDGPPAPLGSVTVGLDPCSVRFRGDGEAWVANFVSDSVSVVDVAGLRVVATIATANEPSDVVFAGSPARAFVSCAQANAVQVFDPASRALVATIPIEGNRPKALAASPDGRTVYAGILESGNRTTIVGSGVGQGFPVPSPVDFPEGPHGGANPPPNDGTAFAPPVNPSIPATNAPPRVGLIVRKDASGRWMDDNRGDWTAYVSGASAAFAGRRPGWDLPDHDLAVIDSATLGVAYATGLMNLCMDVAVNPATGRPTVVGTDAMNHVRFEPALRGTFLRVELATVDPGSLAPAVSDLNPHLDYRSATVPQASRDLSLGDPRGIAWSADGERGYVTGMGSDNLVFLGRDGRRSGTNAVLALGHGPTGMALDERRRRLYVLNRFSATISVVDVDARAVAATVPLFDPTPDVVRLGRPMLYDTHKTSGLGHVACGSCHVDARFDRLAWDLGDPAGTTKAATNANFGVLEPARTIVFHPMKGPMATLTLQDIVGHEPLHWRGDREGIEQFDQTFTNLQAAATGLTPDEMASFKAFLGTIRVPPNPNRTASNTLPASLALPGERALGRGTLRLGSPLPAGDARRGLAIFRKPAGDSGCSRCHALPSGLGAEVASVGYGSGPVPLGPNREHHVGFAATERTALLPFKVPQLRNLHEKAGFDLGSPSGRSGFGYSHDGSVDTLARFVQDSFGIEDDQDTADLVAFLLSFSGSDFEPAAADDNHPPGVASLDSHAATGRQATLSGPGASADLDLLLALAAPGNSRLELVAKGTKDGLARGWLFVPATGRFQSDRARETIAVPELRALAAPGSELTFTLVPRGSGQRIGIDRDGDGRFDRDELDAGTDPANPRAAAPRPRIVSNP